MMNEVFWISHPDAVCDDEKLFRFRKTMPVWDEFDRATVDISAEALAIAAKNAQKNTAVSAVLSLSVNHASILQKTYHFPSFFLSLST